jgi:hypothetical protein
MTLDLVRLEADLVHVEHIVALHLELQATDHAIHTHGQQVWVTVIGAQYEARAWRAAFAGRIRPSEIACGVRTQLVLADRVTVKVVEDGRGESDG